MMYCCVTGGDLDRIARFQAKAPKAIKCKNPLFYHAIKNQADQIEHVTWRISTSFEVFVVSG